MILISLTGSPPAPRGAKIVKNPGIRGFPCASASSAGAAAAAIPRRTSMPPSTSTPLITRSSSPSSPVKIGAGAISTRSCWRRTASLVVYRLAAPLACLRDGLLERLGQAINIGHIIPVDCPRLRFLLRRCRLAIDNDADTLPIGEKFLFDACQVFPEEFF